MAIIEGPRAPRHTTVTKTDTDNSTTTKAREQRDPLFTRYAGETTRAAAETVRGAREMTIQEEMQLIREHARTRAAGAGAGATPQRGLGEAGEVAANGFQYPPGFPRVSREQMERIMPDASQANLDKYVEPLNQAMAQHGINTPERQQAFLAQVAHESGQLNYSEEIASGRAYEGRADLGNTQPGDGVRFKGRGLIQLTGRYNYQQMSEAFGRDLVRNPEQVANDPFLSARVAAYYFEDRGLNQLADNRDFLGVTRGVNGGTNGLADRQRFYAAAQDVIS